MASWAPPLHVPAERAGILAAVSRAVLVEKPRAHGSYIGSIRSRHTPTARFTRTGTFYALPTGSHDINAKADGIANASGCEGAEMDDRSDYRERRFVAVLRLSASGRRCACKARFSAIVHGLASDVPELTDHGSASEAGVCSDDAISGIAALLCVALFPRLRRRAPLHERLRRRDELSDEAVRIIQGWAASRRRSTQKQSKPAAVEK